MDGTNSGEGRGGIYKRRVGFKGGQQLTGVSVTDGACREEGYQARSTLIVKSMCSAHDSS